jgi:NAD(P)-dependent dehydrogenase (short-subunit alcohol dehydrogenase family)
MSDLFRLDGKRVMVVGASRGIGLAIAHAVAEAGAKTVLTSRSRETLHGLAQQFKEDGFEAEWFAADIAESHQVDRLASEVGQVDVLINVSGTNIRKPFQNSSDEEISLVMRTNLMGIERLTRLVGKRMIEQGHGKILFIGSLTSFLGLPYLSIYTMTKSALAGLTRGLAAEWGQHGIQVNCIAPGFIVTDLNREMWEPAEMQEWLRTTAPAGRTGTPEDVAPLAVFLSSKAADYITGQTIAVDGGFSTTSVWPWKPEE